jgi:large repetitive protein
LGCSITWIDSVLSPTPLAMSVAITDETCYNANGIIDVTASGSNGGYGYIVSNNGPPVSQVGATATTSNLPAGTYNINLTDQQGCVLDTNVSLIPLSVPNLNYADIFNPACATDGNGSLEAFLTGGMGDITYTLNPGGVSQVNDGEFTGLSAGSYTVDVLDTNGCTDNLIVDLIDPPFLIENTPALVTQVSCYGLSDGSISFDIAGGTPDYIYSIDNGATTQTLPDFNFLTSGTYNWLVADSNGCSINGVIVLGQPDTLANTSMVVDSASCFEVCDGIITAGIVGGTAPYTYAWTGGLGSGLSDSVTNVCAGTYTLYLRDSLGCEAWFDYTLEQPELLEIISAIPDSVDCYAGATGEIIVDAPNATNFYLIDENGVNIPNGNNNHFNGQLTSNLPAGTYDVVVENANGCSATTSTTIYEPDSIIMSVFRPFTICSFNDFEMSAFTMGGTGPYTYVWDSINLIPGTDTTRLSETSNIVTISNPVDSFAIMVEVTDAFGRTAAQSETVGFSLITPMSLTLMADTVTICAEDSTTIILTPIDGRPEYSYEFYFDGMTYIQGTDSTYTLSDEGHLLFRVTDRCGQEILDSIYISNYSDPVLNLSGSSGCIPTTVTITNPDQFASGCVYTMGDGASYSTCQPVVHTYTSAGNYNVGLSYTTDNGCSFDTIFRGLISVYPNPEVSFFANPYETTVYDTDVRLVNMSTGATNYTWNVSGIGTYVNQDEITVTFPEIVEDYEVCLIGETVYSDTTCSSTYCDTIVIYEDPTIYAPNAIRPNGSIAANQVFLPYINGYNPYKYTLYIFNRWGELLFESHDMNVGWDATYMDQLVQDDVYVWKVIALEERNDERHEYYGHVTVIK